MAISEIHQIEYQFGKQRFILNKAELRSIDDTVQKNNFSIPLNLISPYYDSGSLFSPLFFLFAGYITIGVIVRSLEWFFGSALFDTFGSVQLIVLLFLLFTVGCQLFRYFKTKSEFQFCNTSDGEIAFSIPTHKKSRKNAQQFIKTLVNKIYEATPSNETVLFLLRQYALLTNIESSQLEASIYQKALSSEAITTQNIIQLTK